MGVSVGVGVLVKVGIGVFVIVGSKVLVGVGIAVEPEHPVALTVASSSVTKQMITFFISIFLLQRFLNDFCLGNYRAFSPFMEF